MLGKHYLAKKDYRESIAWLTKSADQGNDQAINELGLIVYLLGSGAASEENKNISLSLEKSLERYQKNRPVIEIFKNDLSKGNLERLHEIGEIYFFGVGAEKDRIIAKNYFEHSSAENVYNSAKSEYRLGEIYLRGLGVIANKQEAVKWFEKSCGRPNAQACEELKALR